MRVLPILSIFILTSASAVAEQAPPQVRFTPGGDCTDLVVTD
jgi:hypothetical protein